MIAVHGTANRPLTPIVGALVAGTGLHSPALAQLIGRWTVEMTTHGPGGATHAAGLAAEKSWFGGGRYVAEELSGQFGVSLHEKRSFLCYNATRGRFEYLTADNHDGVLLLYTAQPSPNETTRIELWADYVSPGDAAPRGVLLCVRTLIEIEGPHEHRLTNFYAEPGRPERPFLEYCYRRAT